MSENLTISCDEAGYTGPDLLSPDQKYFAYGSVSVSDDEAFAIIDTAKKNYRLQMPELKARQLIRTKNGLDALEEVLAKIEGRFAVNVHEKLLALCGHVFEYIFEPVYKYDPFLLYEKNFHKFVAMFSWLWLQGKEDSAHETIKQFQSYMRTLDHENAPILFENKDFEVPLEQLENAPPFDLILRFARGYRETIIKDNADLSELAVDGGKWTIELSASALWSHLNHWGQFNKPLSINCDASKPLQAIASHFSGDENDPAIQRAKAAGHPGPLGWKTTGPIVFMDSRNSPAIQLADLVAGLTVAVVSEKIDDQDRAKTFGAMLRPATLVDSIFPDFEMIDLNQRQPMVNYLVLYDLALRAEKNADPHEGLKDLFRVAEIEWVKGNAPKVRI